MKLEGANALGQIFRSEVQRGNNQPAVLDFGEIQADQTLVTNSFPVPIPASEYLICRSLCIGAKGSSLTKTVSGQGTHPHGPSGKHSHQGISESGDHSHPSTEGTHNHEVLLPDKLRSVCPGDRVLVAWVGSTAVIIDILCPAKEALG